MSNSHSILIDDEDVRSYRENGYLLYHHPLFPAEKFSRLQAFFDQMLAQLPDDARPEGMDVPHFAFPELFEWLLADEVLDFVERFLGPDIVLWSSHFLCKPPGKGMIVPWHEDSAYWGDTLKPHKVMTVWLAIDDSNVENGCMRVIPGTHHNGFSDYEDVTGENKVFKTQIKGDQIDESKAVDLVIRAGECHLHDAKLIHGSNANKSNNRRCGYTMRYMPADCKFTAPEKFPHTVYLARGRNLAGNTIEDPTKKFEIGADRWCAGTLSK
jgi:chlorinating enzyme